MTRFLFQPFVFRRSPLALPTMLHTSRLTLRMFTEADFEAYAGMCTDPDVMRYIGDGKPLDRYLAWRSLAAMLGHWTLRGYGM
jgi:RimJ/RimL family protein N-acetyltransferase